MSRTYQDFVGTEAASRLGEKLARRIQLDER